MARRSVLSRLTYYFSSAAFLIAFITSSVILLAVLVFGNSFGLPNALGVLALGVLVYVLLWSLERAPG